MGMTIDEARTALGKERKYALHENKQAFDVAIDIMRKYQQLQADYENRLKADMVAMLEKLKLEFEEYEPKWAENEDQVIASNRTWEDFDDIIQQKIDALKGENT